MHQQYIKVSTATRKAQNTSRHTLMGLLDRHQYAQLSARAKTLLLAFKCQVTVQSGESNNGQLIGTEFILRQYGLKSWRRIRKAKDELIAAGLLIEHKKQGTRGRHLYTLTPRLPSYNASKQSKESKGSKFTGLLKVLSKLWH